MNVTHLPYTLRFGVAPAMSAKPDTTFWGSKPCNATREIQKACGMLPDHRLHLAASNELQEAIDKHSVHSRQPKARNAFNHIRGAQHGNSHIFRTSLVEGLPPEKVSVYSDGSYRDPKSHYLGLLGLGVWWPDRCLKNQRRQRYIFSRMPHRHKGQLNQDRTGRCSRSTQCQCSNSPWN